MGVKGRKACEKNVIVCCARVEQISYGLVGDVPLTCSSQSILVMWVLMVRTLTAPKPVCVANTCLFLRCTGALTGGCQQNSRFKLA